MSVSNKVALATQPYTFYFRIKAVEKLNLFSLNDFKTLPSTYLFSNLFQNNNSSNSGVDPKVWFLATNESMLNLVFNNNPATDNATYLSYCNSLNGLSNCTFSFESILVSTNRNSANKIVGVEFWMKFSYWNRLYYWDRLSNQYALPENSFLSTDICVKILSECDGGFIRIEHQSRDRNLQANKFKVKFTTDMIKTINSNDFKLSIRTNYKRLFYKANEVESLGIDKVKVSFTNISLIRKSDQIDENQDQTSVINFFFFYYLWLS